MFYKKIAAVVMSIVIAGSVPCTVFADTDASTVTGGEVEELSIEEDFSDGTDSISAFANALADKTVSDVEEYQGAKAEAEEQKQQRKLPVKRKKSVRQLKRQHVRLKKPA